MNNSESNAPVTMPASETPPFRGRLGPRWTWFIGSIAWIALVGVASVQYLRSVQHLYDCHWDNGQWHLPTLYALILLLLLVLAFYALRHVTKVLSKVERDVRAQETGLPSTKVHHSRNAILVVHGMGVQDRYQMLSGFREGITGYAKDHKVTVVQEALTGKNWCTLQVSVSEPGEQSAQLIDVHECFWGHHFNGITKFPSTLIFAASTLYKFLPTIFTRLYRKRISEAIWVSVALGMIGFGLFGIYGGFRLSALRLEHFNLLADNPSKVSEDDRAKLGLAENTRYLEPDKKEVGRMTRPEYDVRLRETKKFVVLSVTSLWEAICSGGLFDSNGRSNILIPVQRPLESIRRHSIGSLVGALVYSIAFALTAMSLVLFWFAQWGLLMSDALGPHAKNRMANYLLGFSNWRNATLDSLRKGVLPLAVLLALDPVIELVLVQLFMTAGLLVLLYKGVQFWFSNFLGDVEIYANTNENSTFWKAREAATSEIQRKIRELLDPNNPQTGHLNYGCVIIVAHSLGSVIALQALRRIAVDEKGGQHESPGMPGIGAFVTIGSPLRKFRQLFRFQPYKWAFSEFNVERDRVIFQGEEVEPHGSLPWHNFWYSSDIFADPLAFVPIGNLKSKLKAVDDHVRGSAVAQVTNPAELDRTGFQVGSSRDHWLGVRWGIWTHSDYWLDRSFVDRLLKITLECGGRGGAAFRDPSAAQSASSLPLVIEPVLRESLAVMPSASVEQSVDYGETQV